MGLISDQAMMDIAIKVRPTVQPIIDRDHELTHAQLRCACRMHGHKIVSERTLSRIMEHIFST